MKRFKDVDLNLNPERFLPFLGGCVEVSFYESTHCIANEFGSVEGGVADRDTEGLDPEDYLVEVDFGKRFIWRPMGNDDLEITEGPG